MTTVAGSGGPDNAIDLRHRTRIHVVGIGGAGMSAIATVLRDMGHEVTGSDLKDSPVAERLRSKGVTVALGHRPENVGHANIVTYSPAVAPDNAELVEAATPLFESSLAPRCSQRSAPHADASPSRKRMARPRRPPCSP